MHVHCFVRTRGISSLRPHTSPLHSKRNEASSRVTGELDPVAYMICSMCDITGKVAADWGRLRGFTQCVPAIAAIVLHIGHAPLLPSPSLLAIYIIFDSI